MRAAAPVRRHDESSGHALRLSPAWPDPGAVQAVIRTGGPFWPLANYAANDAEMAALGSRRASFTPPWFRQDVVLGGRALLEGAELLLDNPLFAAAARTIAGPAAVVRPTTVYVNIMGPTPFAFPPHLDVPAFRGFTRAEHPIWLLKVMMASGLFERWRTKIVTAVSWFYDGPGGDFHYWPEGPDGAAAVEHPPFDNVAVVADNEATFHGVGPLGPPGARMPEGLTSECRLIRAAEAWEVRDAQGTVLVRYSDDEVRTTVSWKADVFADPDEAAAAAGGSDTLDLAQVLTVFDDDLRRRGLAPPRPTEPLADQEWIALLADTYHQASPALR